MSKINECESEGGHLPRTFSTSALRIKQKYSFWERLHSASTSFRDSGIIITKEWVANIITFRHIFDQSKSNNIAQPINHVVIEEIFCLNGPFDSSLNWPNWPLLIMITFMFFGQFLIKAVSFFFAWRHNLALKKAFTYHLQMLIE